MADEDDEASQRVVRSRSGGMEENIPLQTTSSAASDVTNVMMKAKTWRRKSVMPARHAPVIGHRANPEDLLQNQDFLDTPSHIQAKTARSMTTTLHRKKEFLDKVHKVTSEAKQRPGCLKRTKWKIEMGWIRFKNFLEELFHQVELWSGSIKKIESHFGAGITSYFLFLRSLMYLNMMMSPLLLGFIAAPQILYRFFQQDPTGYYYSVPFNGTDLITGGGWFDMTEMYYGYYHNGHITVKTGYNYDMRYAYICTSIAYYLLSVIILAVFLARRYRAHYIEETHAMHNSIIVHIFCGWDYKVVNQEAAHNRHRRNYQALCGHLGDQAENDDKQRPIEIFRWVLIRLILNLTVLGMLCGCGYLVWYISVTQSLSNEYGILSEMAMPLCISGINIIIPFIFTTIGNLEYYKSQRAVLYLTMLRTISLNMVTLGVLLYFWYNSVDCRAVEHGHYWIDENTICSGCWENFMGQQIYRLVMIDFAFTLVLTFLDEFLRRIMGKTCFHLEPPEFNIGRNTLNLIYAQILIWLGTFYSPLLTIIQLVKLFVIFYVKRVSVFQNCAPPSKPWRAGQASTFLQFLLFVSFMISFTAVAYGVMFIPPAEECGPYQSLNTTFGVFDLILEEWKGSENIDVVKGVIETITSMAFLVFFIIGMAVTAYYCKVMANAQHENVQKLRNQIQMEGRDKAFLLKLLHQAQEMRVQEPEQTSVTDYVHQPQTVSSPSSSSTNSNKPPPASGVRRRRAGIDAGKVIQSRPRSHRRKPTDNNSDDIPLQSYNDSYIDQSLDSPDRSTIERREQAASDRGSRSRDTGQNPPGTTNTGSMNRSRSRELQNPAYRDTSPNRPPDLPYPTVAFGNSLQPPKK